MATLTKSWVDNLHAEIRSMFEDARGALERRMPEINENMAFYRGYQWGYATTVGYLVDDRPTDEAQEVYNYVRPTVRSAVAAKIRSLPNIQVVPTGDSMRAIARAQTAQRLLRSALRNGIVPFDELYRGETKAACHGACWYKIFFDPNRGRKDRFPKYKPTVTGDFEPDVDQLGAQKWHTRFEGEVVVEFHDIVDVMVDPHATRESEVRYVFHRKLVPVSTLDDRFPYDAFGKPTKGRWDIDYKEPEQQERDSVENEHRAYDQAGRGVYAGRSEGNRLGMLVEFWMRPTNAHPDGMLFVYSGDVIVAVSKLPYDFPWVLRNGENIVPNALYADGVVRDMKPLQRTMNLTASKRREWVDKILSPALLNPNESGLSRDHFSDIAGEILNYDPLGGKPEWMATPSIPASMFDMEAQLVGLMKDISTYSDITRGEAPKGLETGRALAYLHEFQQGVQEPDVQTFKQVVLEILRKVLRLMRDFYQDGRIVRLLGENNAWERAVFKRDDYDLDAEIEIEIDSGAPNSRALRIAEAMQIFQVGGYNDTPEAQRFRKVANLDFADRNTYDEDERHRRRARKEQVEILDNPLAWPTLLDQDNHGIHIDEHSGFMVTDEYLALPDIARRVFERHLEEHEMLFAEEQGAAGMQEQLLGAGQSGGSPPGQPQLSSPFDGGQGNLEGLSAPEPEMPARETAEVA